MRTVKHQNSLRIRANWLEGYTVRLYIKEPLYKEYKRKCWQIEVQSNAWSNLSVASNSSYVWTSSQLGSWQTDTQRDRDRDGRSNESFMKKK